ncbi:MAG: DUF3079 domain-containing protein [Candidatus Accumulibacter sp.]|nr:DUF3079 domain-containing protein [Accumulibacter sp.]
MKRKRGAPDSVRGEKFPLQPKHPEWICRGCDKYCPVDSLGCGDYYDRTRHPAELLGEDWCNWGIVASPEEEKPRSDCAAEKPG